MVMKSAYQVATKCPQCGKRLFIDHDHDQLVVWCGYGPCPIDEGGTGKTISEAVDNFLHRVDKACQPLFEK